MVAASHTVKHNSRTPRERGAASAQRERAVEDELVRRIEALGGICEKTIALGKRGFPDRTCFLPGSIVLFVELKRPKGGRVSVHQQQYHDRLAMLGVVVYVVRNMDDIEHLINRLSDSSRDKK